MHSTWFHHFKVSKKPGFKMPPCRHRIIIAPPMQELVCETKIPVKAAPPLEEDSLTQSYKTVNIPQEEKQVKPEEDPHLWMAQRLKMKRDLDTFVNLEKWICYKPRITKAENQVLRKIFRDRENDLAALRAAELASAEMIVSKPIFQMKTLSPIISFDYKTLQKPVQHKHRSIPSLIVPEPSCLSVLYEHLLNHRIKVTEMFFKGEWEHHITREEFVDRTKRIGAPLTEREFEDVVIYLCSLSKHSIIYREDLISSYRSWLTAKKNECQKKKQKFEDWKIRLRKQLVKPKKVKIAAPSPSSPKLHYLEVPPINTEPDRMRLTYEEMEEAGKRYRELKRKSKKKINPLLFMEECRLVRTGNKAYYDDHCLPSTLPDELGKLTNAFRQATFLVYLSCVKACEAYQIPLTEKILMKALLYPGDKLIMESGNVRKLRQPGGYYDEVKEFISTKTKFYTIKESVARKKSQRPSKKMTFGEFETLTRKLKDKTPSKRYSKIRCTHPNFFWPGHLLDKLLFYLPDKKWEKQLTLFSRIKKLPHAYPAIYHPDRFWPISEAGYVTYGNFDEHTFDIDLVQQQYWTSLGTRLQIHSCRDPNLVSTLPPPS